MIITLESIFSERGKLNEKPILNSLQHTEYNTQNILDIMKYSDDTNLSFNVSHHLRGGFIVSKKNNKSFSFLLNTNPEKIKMLEKIMKNNNFKVRNKMNIIDDFFNFKKNNLKFENIYRPKYEELLRRSEVKIYKLNYRAEEERKNLIKQNLRLPKNSQLYKLNLIKIAQIEAEHRYIKTVTQISFIKLLIISTIILTLRIMPKFIKKFFLYIKQKNRSNEYLNKNMLTIRNLLMLPNLSLIKIIVNRINIINRN
jgi:hypothetical protein